MLVEVVVERAGVDLHVGIELLNVLNALGSGDEHHELDVLAAALLHLADGLGGAAAGGEHGIDDQHVALGHVLGHLAEVGMGLERFFIAVHADVAHARGGDHAQHAVDQTETGTEDGDDHELAAGKGGGVHLADGRFNVLGGERKIAGRLVGDEHTDLADQLAEILDAGVLVAHDRQLVRHEGMVHDVYLAAKFRFHCFVLRKLYIYSWVASCCNLALRSRSACEMRR